MTHLFELDAKMITDVKVLAKDSLQRSCTLGIDAGKLKVGTGEGVGGRHNQLQGLDWGCSTQWCLHRGGTC